MKLGDSIRDNWIFKILVHGNFYLALSAGAVAFTTLALAGYPLRFEPVLISFSIVFFMYNVNRFTDIDEDEVNEPERASFVRKYGKILLVSSILIYLISLGLAWENSLLTLTLALGNIGLGISYSVLRLKEKLFFKNFIVATGWAVLPLIAGSYYSLTDPEIVFSAFYFGMAIFNNTVIFDIKDILGDRKEGVSTLPNTLGLEKSRLLIHLSNIGLALTVVLLVVSEIISYRFLILLMLNVYAALYIQFADENRSTIFYGLVVDGEYIFILAITILVQWV